MEEEKQTYFSSTRDYYEATAMKTGWYSQMNDETKDSARGKRAPWKAFVYDKNGMSVQWGRALTFQ